jgi:hypothetical protein
MPAPRRFPLPWTVEETEACFIVKDKNGQALAYVYFEDEPGRRSAASLLTKDEARRIAANMARLPDSVAASKNLEKPVAQRISHAFPCLPPKTCQTRPGRLRWVPIRGST